MTYFKNSFFAKNKKENKIFCWGKNDYAQLGKQTC